MALKSCKECGQEVSTDAKECPNCGVRNPAGWYHAAVRYEGIGGGGCLKFLGCIVLLLILAGMCSGGVLVV